MQGIEMMLRNMGLASVLDAAKQLAESGAVHKIIAFADQAGEINERLTEIERVLRIERPGPIIEGTARLRGSEVEPGSDAGTDRRTTAA